MCHFGNFYSGVHVKTLKSAISWKLLIVERDWWKFRTLVPMNCIRKVLFLSDSLTSVWVHLVQFIKSSMLKFWKGYCSPRFRPTSTNLYGKHVRQSVGFTLQKVKRKGLWASWWNLELIVIRLPHPHRPIGPLVNYVIMVSSRGQCMLAYHCVFSTSLARLPKIYWILPGVTFLHCFRVRNIARCFLRYIPTQHSKVNISWFISICFFYPLDDWDGMARVSPYQQYYNACIIFFFQIYNKILIIWT